VDKIPETAAPVVWTGNRAAVCFVSAGIGAADRQAKKFSEQL
jgi:hypothetical protein